MNSTIKNKHEIWYWYKHFEAYFASGLRKHEYCKKCNLDYKEFCNMFYRLIFIKFSKPDLYKDSIPIARKYMESTDTKAQFLKEHDIRPNLLKELVTHLKYQDVIDSMLQNPPKNQMNFIHVPKLPNSNGGSPISEIIEKQNDLELVIAKGVKVLISPNIDSVKIIKIIELLKDL